MSQTSNETVVVAGRSSVLCDEPEAPNRYTGANVGSTGKPGRGVLSKNVLQELTHICAVFQALFYENCNFGTIDSAKKNVFLAVKCKWVTKTCFLLHIWKEHIEYCRLDHSNVSSFRTNQKL